MKKQNVILVTDDGTKKTSELLADLKALFPAWSYYDEDLDQNFPPIKSSRAFRNTQEPDEDTADKSANDLANDGKEYMTLRERLIFELLYFKETGNHLDVYNVTLCAGSRYADGGVPSVGWGAVFRKLYVYWYDPQNAYGNLRARAAVSLESSPLSASDLETRVANLEAWRDGLIKVWEEQLKKMPK